MMTWTTKDGQEVPVADLADSHLWNILRLVIRNAEKNLAECQRQMAMSPTPFGEIAGYDFDCMEESLNEMDAVEFVRQHHSGVFEEAERRGFDWQSKVEEWLK